MTAPSPISEPAIEILDLRHFPPASLRPLLEEEARAWAQTLAWDYSGSADMILHYVEAKILPGYVAVRHGQPTGYCFFVYEGNKGVIGDLYVNSAVDDDRALERQLLEQGITTLQHSPGLQRIEAQLLLHPSGALATPFLSTGFRQFPRLFMSLPLAEESPRRGARAGLPFSLKRPPSAPADIDIRPWADHDYSAAAGVITNSYQGHIDGEINDQYRSVPGSLRFLNNIVRFPGCGVFDGNASFVAINRSTRGLVGMLLCSRVKDDVGHVTQLCVVPGQRGRHIGETLLKLTASELRKRGFSALTLTVTETNQRAVAIYQRLGYRIQRLFDAFVWDKRTTV